MATIALLKTATDTTDGFGPYSSGSYTPTAGRLQVVIIHFRGSETGPVTVTNSAGINFTEITQARWGSSIQRLKVGIADAVSTAVSQTTSWTISGDNASSSNIAVLEIDGLADVGQVAVVQSAITENGATGGTPAVTFAAAAQGTNPVLFVVGCAVNPAGITAPDGFAGLVNIGVDTPTTGLHASGDDTGFSSDTVTAGSISGGQYAVIGVEFAAASEDSGGEAVPEPRPTGGGKGKKHKSIPRRRILLPDGRILIPATEADYRHAVEWVIALQPSQEPREAPPAPTPVAAKPKTVRRLKAPKSPRHAPLPAEFYRALDLHKDAVLYWREISQAYAAYQAAEADEEEAVELLLLAS